MVFSLRATVRSKPVVLLLLICCLVCFQLVVGVLCLSLFYCALLCVLSSFVPILKRKWELVAVLLLSYGSLVTVNKLWLFLTVQWVGLRCVFVVFPDQTHLLILSFFQCTAITLISLPRLIRNFAVRKCHLTGFVMQQLILSTFYWIKYRKWRNYIKHRISNDVYPILKRMH